MIKDITYCSHTSCIHRRGCKRSLSNYNIPEKNGLLLSVFDGSICANTKDSDDWGDRFGYLIRFRNSDGSALNDN